MKIVGIDPGHTVGLCLYRYGTFRDGTEVISVEGIIEYIDLHQPDQVVMEDFILSPRPANAKIPIEQIGVIKYYCAKHGIPLAMQSPSALIFGRKHLGQSHASPHVKSACCHVIYFRYRRKHAPS